MTITAFKNVWDAIEADPGERLNLQIRAHLMTAIQDAIRDKGWAQSETAERLHVTQPRVSDLMRGKISNFTIDTLTNMASAVGLRVNVEIAKAA